MEIKMPKSTAPRPDITKVKDSKKGTVTLLEETRLAENQTKESTNLIQVQDGIWKTRWGREFYGEAIETETNFDAAFEYIKDRGMVTEERQIVVCGSSGDLYMSNDDADSWTLLAGSTGAVSLTGGNLVSGLQIDDHLYMCNGIDPLLRYNGTNLVEYSGIDTPTNLAAARTNLTTGGFKAFYQVTALNEVGETVACVAVSKDFNKHRDAWVATEGVTLTWDAVTDALRYQVYYSDEEGYEALLDSCTENTYFDEGDPDTSKEPNPYIVSPVDDTTTGPRFAHIELSGNRIWGTNDPENPQIVYFSGVGQFISFFSPYYGGGWILLEYGGREVCVGVVNYRTGKGDEVATVFTKTPEGTGSIWQVELDVATSDTLTFTLPIPAKVVDYIGCTSQYAIVKAGDKVFFPNINGIFDLGNKEEMYNILVSDETSQSIRPNYRNFNEPLLGEMTGYYYDAKLFFSTSISGTDNDLIFIYDAERKNWNYAWNFGVKQFFESTDLQKSHHFLYVPTEGNRLCEINDNFDRDFGGAFSTSYVSGLFSFDDRMDAFAKVYQGIVEFGHLKGNVTFEILGVQRVLGFRSISVRDYVGPATTSSIDFTNTLFGDYAFGEGSAIPSASTEATIKRRLRINKRLNRIQFRISSVEPGTQYSILGLQANGRGIPMNPPNIWRN